MFASANDGDSASSSGLPASSSSPGGERGGAPGGGLALVWLVRSGFGRPAVLASIALTPVLILLAPAPGELAVTMAVEAPIVWALFSLPRADRWRAVLTSLLVNALTQPLLYLAVLHLPTGLVLWRAALAGVSSWCRSSRGSSISSACLACGERAGR